jgi:hypothetical protein
MKACLLALSLAALVWIPPIAAAEEVDPIVRASPYGDKYVWSYSDITKAPLPWTMFHPNHFCSIPVTFDSTGVRSVGEAPPPGVHPRIFFSPQDLPAIRQRLHNTRAGQEAYKTLLGYCNALKLTYDPNADYAKPDWMKGAFGVHGRAPLYRTGGYGKREDFYTELAEGKKPTKPYGLYNPGSLEAFRCLIDEDAPAAQKLARATVTQIRLDQQARAEKDKITDPTGTPNPSCNRLESCNLGFIYDFIFNYLTPEQKKIIHDELVMRSAWQDNYGTFNDADGARSNWATFSYWVFDLMAIEGEPGFNDLKFRGLYRGWRDFLTASFFRNGAAFEGEGKLLFGLDAVVAFDRVASKYGLQPLAAHPTPRNTMGGFLASSMLPTRDSFAVFDILGGMGKGVTVPSDVVVAKYLYPNDKRIDLVYRDVVSDDFSALPNRCDSLANGVITSAVFATDYDPQNAPDKAGLPLSYFDGQRAVMMTRSSWAQEAAMLTMHVRGASGGHPYRDRNGIMFAAAGRPWVTIPGHGGEIHGWACNTVLIDGREQNNSTPARVVDYVDSPNATFMVGDSKYCWDWVWRVTNHSKDGQPLTRADVDAGNVDTSGCELLNQCFNDFAYEKQKARAYDLPLKYAPSWILPEGYVASYTRQVNTPVLKSFRTAGIVRGPHPYALVVDDVDRDGFPTRYDWHLTLMSDVVQLKQPLAGANADDLLFAGKASIDADGAIKPGEPVLLVRLLQSNGEPIPPTFEAREGLNFLTLSTRAIDPGFKVLLMGLRAGAALPKTTWDSQHQSVSVSFPDQEDRITFSPNPQGKTDVRITRGSAPIAEVSKMSNPLSDPEDEALTQQLRQVPRIVEKLASFHADALPGLIASYSFDAIEDGRFPATTSNAPAIDADPSQADPNGVVGGCLHLAGQHNSLKIPLDLHGKITTGLTISLWLKVENTSDNILAATPGNRGLSLDFVQGDLRFSTLGTWGPRLDSSTLSSWNNFTYTWDGTQGRLYRDTHLIDQIPGTHFEPPKSIDLGSGKFAGYIDDLRIYNRPLQADEIEAIYLKSGHLGKD